MGAVTGGRKAEWNRRAAGLALTMMALILVASTGWTVSAQSPVPAGEPVQIPLASKAAIVMDAASGRILFEHNAHQPLPPASVTKVMTLVLALEAVERGDVSLTDMVTTSSRAASMGGTQIWLETGERMAFGDLLYAIAVGSANDASVAVAEYLAGTESAFAVRMTERARELGALNTQFLNASGLPPQTVGLTGDHVTSAYDMALISRHALTLPHFLELVSTYGPVVMRPDGKREPELYNYNRMLRTYPGMDGIKTGYTSEAGYSLAATASRGGVRVIVVTFGAPTSSSRDDDVRRLLDFGFSRLHAVLVRTAGEAVRTARVHRGIPEEVDLIVQQDVYATLLRGESEAFDEEVVWHLPRLEAPLGAGTVVGELVVRTGEYEVARAPVVVAQDVERASVTQMILRTARRLLARQFD